MGTIKLIFGTLLGIGSLVLALLTYFLGWKKWMIPMEKCTERTKGTVVGYTFASRAQNAPIHLPVVEYVANGKKYKVVGPVYKWVSEKSKRSLRSKNEIKEFDPHEEFLRLDVLKNSMFSIQANPFALYFPKGSQMDVFYNPNKPGQSYAYRYCDQSFKFYMLFGGFALIFSILCYVLFCL